MTEKHDIVFLLWVWSAFDELLVGAKDLIVVAWLALGWHELIPKLVDSFVFREETVSADIDVVALVFRGA